MHHFRCLRGRLVWPHRRSPQVGGVCGGTSHSATALCEWAPHPRPRQPPKARPSPGSEAAVLTLVLARCRARCASAVAGSRTGSAGKWLAQHHQSLPLLSVPGVSLESHP
ncbi:hypothetical protein ADK90_14550 [Streptomyces sp. XY413]|nr:hypothetical protein ADK90_14550 [Streptomyces sp. XY413]